MNASTRAGIEPSYCEAVVRALPVFQSDKLQSKLHFREKPHRSGNLTVSQVAVNLAFMCGQDAQKCALIDLKTGKGGSPSWVQIPPPPPNTPDSMMMPSGFFWYWENRNFWWVDEFSALNEVDETAAG